MSKHTKGPWKVDGRRVRLGKIVTYKGAEPREFFVEQTPRGSFVSEPPYDEELDANAALIAAAPELLDALKECVDELDASGASTHPDDGGVPGPYFRYVAALKAIAKAEGK